MWRISNDPTYILSRNEFILLRKSYSNNPMQLGFQKRKSPEGAILRATELQNIGQSCIAALDLTAAYDSVPRGPLIQRMREVLQKNLCDMIEVFFDSFLHSHSRRY